ncbi:phosphatase [Selenomonas sp. TAMA-11512]|uniref:phosphatase n=1 Tax=Selenomonas sp. TAMA-11512 TaxID=3095337 RepID=UPI003084ED6C|nr:phosphatase [Selenomonas sp. TAMA-11512]
MQDLLDIHTHTLASGHAYSSPREMVAAARRKKLALYGMSEHTTLMPGTCHDFYFANLKVIRPEDDGIELLMGAELNIIDYGGSTDLMQFYLKNLDYAIASLHNPCIPPGTAEENTTALIGAMRNPKVCILGHPDNPAYPVDLERLVRAAKENRILLECNNSSYSLNSSRSGSREIGVQMLDLCRKHGVPVILGSDAHIDLDVGNHDNCMEVLAAADFPDSLVVNYDIDFFKSFLPKK